MASPVVAGIAALYLQMHPNADWREVKDAIILSAKTDQYTGVVPNNLFGHGKVCALNVLQMDLQYGCTDPAALNYDLNANMEDGSCIPIIYGCMDMDALNYDSTATVSDTCFYEDTTSIHDLRSDYGFVGFYPNPFLPVVIPKSDLVRNFRYESQILVRGSIARHGASASQI